ncbi:MAG: AsmA family protein [Terriglobales bacterium]
MKFLRSSRGRVFAGIVLVLALFLIRPGAQRLRTRIVRSISLAIGRPVDVGSVTLRLLPQPGFDLENFVVHEDPAFGVEPVLQSADVVATIRVTSLLRGRLEIARLSLTEPSINLVRNGEGRWNLEKLIERAASTPVAPTAKTRGEARPGFPYIEADHGRINFKFGQEKKPYSLTEANFALWQDSENTWGMRLKAQPTRTDFNLSDTGILAMDGSWQRSSDLHETPVQFTLQWEGAQLGQVTKLTMGQDKGWRGGVRLSATLTGTPKDLTVDTDGSIEDFRRYDISGEKALRLAARCSGHYSSTDHILSRLDCHAPVGEGEITLNGSLAPMPGSHAYDLTMLVQSLPLQPIVELARRVKKNVPTEIIAAGKVDASITLRRAANSAGMGPVWQGGGEVSSLNVRSPLTNTRLALDKIPFTVSSSTDDYGPKTKGERTHGSIALGEMDPRVDIGPFNLALGKTTSATVRGQFSRFAYNVLVQGDAEIQRLLEVARTVGLPAPQTPATGEARISLHVGGSWAGFAAAAVTGTAQLHSLHARVRGLNEALEISSASIELTPTSSEVRKLTASVGGNTWHGSLTVPRQCEKAQACPIRFDLHADEFATDALSGAVNESPGKEPWYRFLSSPAQPKPYLASLHAVGKLTAGRVLIHNLVANHVSTEVEVEQGRLRLSNLRADVMGGRHTGDWQLDFTVNPPTYRGHGALEKVVLGEIAEAMHDDWLTGTANVEYRADTQGWTKAELISHADASFQVEAHDGSLPHLILAGDSNPLRVNRFVGLLLLRDGKFEIDQGKLQTSGGIYQISGTASLDRVLDFKLGRDGTRGFNITGTVDQPHVVINPTPDTQAALKP